MSSQIFNMAVSIIARNELMDEDAMIKWVKNICKPYIEILCRNIVEYYSCHMLMLVVEAIP